jgi:transcriptional regulator with XRE-family HTH domain
LTKKKAQKTEIDTSTPGARLRIIRNALGFNQRELGDSIGVKLTVISDIEQNRSKPLLK